MFPTAGNQWLRTLVASMLDEYKAAQSFSVEIIPLRDWTQWLGK